MTILIRALADDKLLIVRHRIEGLNNGHLDPPLKFHRSTAKIAENDSGTTWLYP
jgi:hypothetical protein